MFSRRRLLAACAPAAGALVAGCLSGVPGGDERTPEDCTATAPPAPTDAATEPRPYPERPTELSTDTVEAFLREYENAYQYNDALAANPNKIGRTNELTVYLCSVSVQTDDGRFTGEVTGQLQYAIVDPASESTPATPTETPLPMGRGPFETAYTVTDRWLRRDGVVVECW